MNMTKTIVKVHINIMYLTQTIAPVIQSFNARLSIMVITRFQTFPGEFA